MREVLHFMCVYVYEVQIHTCVWEICVSEACIYITKNSITDTLPKISLATLEGRIVDPEIAVESENYNALKAHGART